MMCIWEWEYFDTAVGEGAALQNCEVHSQSQKSQQLANNCGVTGTHQELNQPPADVLSLNITDFPFKKHIFPLSPRQWGISRSKMSCLKGSTVNTCRIFFPLLSVSTSASGSQCHGSVPEDALPVWVSRAECWLWLSRMPCSLHHSKPIFD